MTLPPAPVRPAAVTGLVEFRDISFGYPGSDQPVLNGLSFTLRPVFSVTDGSGSPCLYCAVDRRARLLPSPWEGLTWQGRDKPDG